MGVRNDIRRVADSRCGYHDCLFTNHQYSGVLFGGKQADGRSFISWTNRPLGQHRMWHDAVRGRGALYPADTGERRNATDDDLFVSYQKHGAGLRGCIS